jgi:hypothetical protein
MNKTMRVLLLAVAVSAFGATMRLPLRAADAPANSTWDNLKTLSAGQEIHVVLNGAQSFQGTFQSLSEGGITLRQSGGDQTVARQDVLRVSSKGQKHRGRNALIGAAVGAGVGLGLGAAADRSSQNDIIKLHHWGLAVGAPLGALIGAGGGALLPTGNWHDVYRAR